MKRKEILWLIGTSIVILFFYFLLFGIDGYKLSTDINIHSTYFVIANSQFLLQLTLFVFFSVYLLRMLSGEFKNLPVNFIFIIIGLMSILNLTGIVSIVNSYTGITNQSEDPIKNILNTIYWVLYFTQIIIVVLITYSGFKIGQNYSKLDKNNNA